MSTSGNLSKQEILKIYQKNSAYNQSHKSDEILSILGGIDNILKIALISDDFTLNNNQLSRIHKLITTNSPIQQHSQYQYDSDLEISKTHWTYYFFESIQQSLVS